jgi:hypothetical protein
VTKTFIHIKPTPAHFLKVPTMSEIQFSDKGTYQKGRYLDQMRFYLLIAGNPNLYIFKQWV